MSVGLCQSRQLIILSSYCCLSQPYLRVDALVMRQKALQQGPAFQHPPDEAVVAETSRLQMRIGADADATHQLIDTRAMLGFNVNVCSNAFTACKLQCCWCPDTAKHYAHEDCFSACYS